MDADSLCWSSKLGNHHMYEWFRAVRVELLVPRSKILVVCWIDSLRPLLCLSVCNSIVLKWQRIEQDTLTQSNNGWVTA